jgi:hypothetical protein
MVWLRVAAYNFNGISINPKLNAPDQMTHVVPFIMEGLRFINADQVAARAAMLHRAR